MDFASISFNARSNRAVGLKLDFRFDDISLPPMILTDTIQQFRHEFNDSSASHKFEIILSGKQPEMTKLDHKGNIVEDVFAEIFDFKIAEIELGQVFYGQSIYFYHGKLGQFYKQLGCNGIVTFNFYSPVYVWLMENL